MSRLVLLLFGLPLLAQQKEVVNLAPASAPDENPQLAELLKIRRLHVDRLAGGETAVQIRDMLIGALQATRLFIVTENAEKADTFLRGSAEDLVFTDTFSSSEGVHARIYAGNTKATGNSSRIPGLSVGENESLRIAERKHEALATVRLVNKEGDVIWSTTQESLGGKFRGSSADVTDKVTRQLIEDFHRARKLSGRPPSESGSAFAVR